MRPAPYSASWIRPSAPRSTRRPGPSRGPSLDGTWRSRSPTPGPGMFNGASRSSPRGALGLVQLGSLEAAPNQGAEHVLVHGVKALDVHAASSRGVGAEVGEHL